MLHLNCVRGYRLYNRGGGRDWLKKNLSKAILLRTYNTAIYPKKLSLSLSPVGGIPIVILYYKSPLLTLFTQTIYPQMFGLWLLRRRDCRINTLGIKKLSLSPVGGIPIVILYYKSPLLTLFAQTIYPQIFGSLR